MQKLSARLECIAGAVKPCTSAADIGTDHGYIPIYLCMNDIVGFAVAGDVSRGSAQKALDNVRACGLSDRISVRVGDGIKILRPEDKTECIIIAGMGGMLMCDILSGGNISSVKQLVLQPQKDIPAVRRYIHGAGFKIENEIMIYEDNKYYNIISAVRGSEEYTPLEYALGRILLNNGDAVLKTWLEKEIKRSEKLMPSVNEKRREELENMLAVYREGMKCL